MSRFSKSFLFLFSFATLIFAEPAISESRFPSKNIVSVEFPFEGGVMVMGTKSWRLHRIIEAGFVLGGGQIQREFEESFPNGEKISFETKSTVFPFVGPQLSLDFSWIGISAAYGIYWADVDINGHSNRVGDLTGRKKSWGTGFYSPLLVFDFYNRNKDMFFGLGVGGFWGTSFPNLNVKSLGNERAVSESPIDGLTLHFRMLWAGDRRKNNRKDEGL